MSIAGSLKYYRSLLLSKKLKGPTVVIESDDWGSERIPNLTVQNELAKLGLDIRSNPYVKFDSLERLEDVESLEVLLNKIYADFGKKVLITGNFVMANPDYEAIRKNNFSSYVAEPFTSTYLKRDGNDTVRQSLNRLIKAGYMQPQFHAREHINVSLWMTELQNRQSDYAKAFQLNCCGIDSRVKSVNRNNLLAAFEYFTAVQKQVVMQSIEEGLAQFKAEFGMASTTLVAPRHVWNQDLELVFKANEVTTVQSSLVQLIPGTENYRQRYLFTGQKNAHTGILYLVRNVYFETAYNQQFDWVKQALAKINTLFFLNIPVVIGMHRINFSGGIHPENRERGLKEFERLLRAILTKYPQTNFLSSDQLAKMVN